MFYASITPSATLFFLCQINLKNEKKNFFKLKYFQKREFNKVVLDITCT